MLHDPCPLFTYSTSARTTRTIASERANVGLCKLRSRLEHRHPLTISPSSIMAGERTSSDIQVLPAQSSVPFDSNATSAMPVTPAESSFTDKGAATPGRSNFTDKGAVTPGAESSSECRKEQPSVGAPKDRPTWKFVIIIVSLVFRSFAAGVAGTS